MASFLPLLGLVSIPLAVLAVAFLAVYLYRMDFLESLMGDVDTFWAERAFWAWTPKRLRRPKTHRRRKRKKVRRKEEIEQAREAAEKAARWPYE